MAEDDGSVGHGLGGEAATLIVREEEDVVATRQALGGVPVGQRAAHTLHRRVRLMDRVGRVGGVGAVGGAVEQESGGSRVDAVGRVGGVGEQESGVSRVGAVGRRSR